MPLTEEGRQKLREAGKRGGEKVTGKGGFAYMKEHDPERLTEISKKAVKAKHDKKQTREVQDNI